MTTNPTMTDRPSAARSLREICEAARQANCGECWQVPDVPCTRNPEGDHVARFGRAMRRGLISGAELVAVLDTFKAFTTATIVEMPGSYQAPPDGTPACTCTDPGCPDPVHQSPGGAA